MSHCLKTGNMSLMFPFVLRDAKLLLVMRL